MITKIFPTIMITLCLISSIVYLFNGNIRMTLYWLAASVLTASVTY